MLSKTTAEICNDLVQKLKEHFARENLILTAAVAAGKGTIDAGYEIAEVCE